MDKNKLLSQITSVLQFVRDTEDFDGAIIKLDSIKIKSLIQYYMNTSDNINSNLDKDIIGSIISVLQFIYNNSSKEIISDSDYDLLYEIYMSQDSRDIIGASNLKNRIIRNHQYPNLRGTLKKAHFITNEEKGADKRQSLEGFISSIENKLGRKMTEDECMCYIYPKFDGVSAVFELDDSMIEHVLTRGEVDTNEASDIYPLFSNTKMEIANITKGNKVGVKTELVMKFSDFKEFCEKYGAFKSPRQAVSSIVNSLDYDKEKVKFLTIVQLRLSMYNDEKIIVSPSAYTDYPYEKCNIKHFETLRKKLDIIRRCMGCIHDIPIDGCVLLLYHPNIEKIMGREDNINRFEIAFKFPPETKKSKIIDVDFQIGLLGTITPVAKIEPVVMNYNTIKSISLGSIDIFKSLNMRIGDEVIVRYEIVPNLIKDETCISGDGDVILVPTKCKYCNNDLVEEPLLRCVNPDCSSLNIGKIVNFINKMNIECIGPETVAMFYDNDIVTKIEDLYNLKDKKNTIIQLDGFGKKSYNNIIKSIDDRKDVFDYDLFGSLGIPGVGSRIFKKILNIYYIDELINICINKDIKKLIDIKSIGNKIAMSIIVGVNKNIQLIKYLRSVLTCKRDDRIYSLSVLFSGIRDNDFEDYLSDKKNVNVVSSYSKAIDLLIVKDKSVSTSKTEKALKDGKKILTIDEAYGFFEYTLT